MPEISLFDALQWLSDELEMARSALKRDDALAAYQALERAGGAQSAIVRAVRDRLAPSERGTDAA